MQLQALRPADKIIHFIKYIYDQGYQDIPRGFILYVKTRDKASLMRLGSRSWGRRRRRRGGSLGLSHKAVDDGRKQALRGEIDTQYHTNGHKDGRKYVHTYG